MGELSFIFDILRMHFLFLGLPIMIAEFTIGRHSKASTGEAFKVWRQKVIGSGSDI